jgi:hypothetical protein
VPKRNCAADRVTDAVLQVVEWACCPRSSSRPQSSSCSSSSSAVSKTTHRSTEFGSCKQIHRTLPDLTVHSRNGRTSTCAATTTKTAATPCLVSHLATPGKVIAAELQQLSLGMSHMQPLTRDRSVLMDIRYSNHGHGTTSKYYYYMWRFGWVFYLMSFVLAVFGLFSSLLAPCSRLASGLSGLIIGSSLFFFSIAAPLMT